MNTDFEGGMRRAAEIARMFADENMRMADDTVHLDPILNDQKRAGLKTLRDVTLAGITSEKLQVDGANYAARSHAAQDILEAILAEIA